MKLTQNFSLEEFTKYPLTDYQMQLVCLLANNLQKVRDLCNTPALAKKGKQVSITITSGVRTQDDYSRLVKQGYHPSKKSDHFCGVQIDGNPTLGAADIVINNISVSLKEIVRQIIKWDEQGLIHFGQVIYEYNPNTKKSWIHLGNDWNLIFKDTRCFVNKKKYLMSMDNGKTYKEFK